MVLKLALLLCDTPHPDVVETHGDYRVIYAEFLKNSLPSGDTEYAIDSYDVVHKMEYPPADKTDEYTGIILTGSVASAYQELEWINKLVAYMAVIIETKPEIRIIGICFGHQIIARACGGRCVPNDGKWELGPTPLDLTPLGKELFEADTLNIQQVHRDHVPEIPPAFHILATTQICYNQAMVRLYPTSSPENSTPHVAPNLSNVHIFTIQGHPEFIEPIVSKIVEIRSQSGIIGAEVVADAIRRKDWRNDGVAVVGKAIWRVLGVSTG
ncbi:class I glutamine amidotransferase-like protein [Pluteus cervinus]|uniref:Class I glutamine amidotransferase-like protein n=1 Tax=Pluteus cervinus TaxID=181527 RepID=A0ACD3AJE8_9AGAR|nr:class I glutamine amidotransferase-like protein [Pluteus cervinus]